MLRQGDRGIGGCIRSAGLASLWPILVVVAVLAATDRLAWRLSGGATGDWAGIEAQVATLRPDRPVLAIIGSSRSHMGLPPDLLAEEIAARGLPYQAVNLSVTGGGTPSLALAVLADKTSLLRRLPAGSRVVYVWSPFEMNFLQRRRMLSLPTGLAMMAQFSMVDTASWAYALRDISGFARLAFNDAWMDWPYPFNRIMEASIQPMLLKDATHGCNAAGLANYQILPISRWAMDQLAAHFGPALTLVSPPVSPRQRKVDEESGAVATATPWIEDFAAANHLRFDPGFGDRLGLSELAFAVDCDHLHRPEDRRLFVKAVVDLLR